jgi:preprotein translocase subunit Sec61beta
LAVFHSLDIGALAFALLTFIQSGLLGFFDKESLEQPRFIIAVSFLVGYFSDNAVSALARLARHVFGEDETRK